MNKNILFRTGILFIAVVAVIAAWVFDANHNYLKSSSEEQKDIKGNVGGNLEYQILDVVLGEAQKESKLLFLTKDISVKGNLKDTGLLDLPIFEKNQRIDFKGTVNYYVDLNYLKESSISVDKMSKTICIYIPKPIHEIITDPTRYEIHESQNGLIRFGELKLTAESFVKVEKDSIATIEKKIEEKTYKEKAELEAKKRIKEIYDSSLKKVAPKYKVKVVIR
jgi:hypothetical protein